MTATVLVMAKVPVPGRVKTRLAATEGAERAAALAGAALLDTLDVCAEAFPQGHRMAALEGDFGGLAATLGLAQALAHWHVVHQDGGDLAERIAAAHRRAHHVLGGPVVQIGMDTPQLTSGVLGGVATVAGSTQRPVLGPARDGGWWVLATVSAQDVAGLERVAMSRSDTWRATFHAVLRNGRTPLAAPLMADVDVAADADEAARLAPHTRFARAWLDRPGPQGLPR